MSESVKFEFSVSIDELKSCERLSNSVIPDEQGSPLLRDDLAHFRNVVYRLRQAFAGVPEGTAPNQGVTTQAGAAPSETPASETVQLLCEAVLATAEAFRNEQDSPSGWGSLKASELLAHNIINRK